MWTVEYRNAYSGPSLSLIDIDPKPINLIWTDPPVKDKTDEAEKTLRDIWTPYLAEDGLIIFNPRNNWDDWYEWVKYQVLKYSKEGDLVVDIFCGESTTGVVAISHGRNYYGLDIDLRPLRISRERLEAVGRN